MVMFIYFDIFLLLSVLFTCRTEAPSALTDVVEAKQYSERNKKETLTGVTLASFHGYIWTPPTSAGSISTVTAAKTQKLFFWSFSEQRAAVVCRGCGVTYLPYHKLPYRLKIGRGFFFQITFTNLTKSLLWCRNTIKKKKIKRITLCFILKRTTALPQTRPVLNSIDAVTVQLWNVLLYFTMMFVLEKPRVLSVDSTRAHSAGPGGAPAPTGDSCLILSQCQYHWVTWSPFLLCFSSSISPYLPTNIQYLLRQLIF